MLLPCLPHHPKPVVRILESLVIHPPEQPPSDQLAAALGEITFLPESASLARVRAALQKFMPPAETLTLRYVLQRCSLGVAHESREVRAMAAQQLLQTLRRAELKAEQLETAAAAEASTGGGAVPLGSARLRAPSQARSDPELEGLLTSSDAPDVALVSELLHRLLHCVHESHNAAAPSVAARDELARTAECALQSLGQIGAHDPAKIGGPPPGLDAAGTEMPSRATSPSGHGAASGSTGSGGGGTLFDALASDDLIAERMLEGPLLRMMRSAAEGRVPAAGCTLRVPANMHRLARRFFRLLT